MAVLLLAGCVLAGAAVLRSAEYDEQYTLFVTSETPRPDWPVAAFPASAALRMQAPRAGFAAITEALRQTDVHPPLYFWAVSAWRLGVDEGLPASRLLSAAFALAALAAVGLIAREAGIPAPLAMALTLGCYGFAYTGSIARGFAMAQMLSLWGVWLLCARRGRMAGAAAGALFGAAILTNYLATFVGCAALLWRLRSGWRTAAAPMLGFAAFLPAALWFFLAQRNSRDGQFPPFQPLGALLRLARSAGGSVFGGLPLYMPSPWSVWAAVALSVLLAAMAGLVVLRWRRLDGRLRMLLATGALAPPCGLLLLGVVFGNTPIELRYLAFALPFFALLLAGAIVSLRRSIGASLASAVLCVQALAIAGLLTRPETMQPAREAAREAAEIAAGDVVLLPRGDDGVGIPAAFARETSSATRLLVIAAGETPAAVRARAAAFPRVAVAAIAQDAASRAVIATMRAAFVDPCWRPLTSGRIIALYERVCRDE
jgi:hypothetical protein